MVKAFKVKYKDWVLLPAIILLMNGINLYIAHPPYVFTLSFFRALFEDTVLVMICWLAMRRLITSLDSYYPYQRSFVKRIILQVFLTLVLTCSLLLTGTWIVEHCLYKRPVPTEVYTHHIWVYAFWILIQNGIYITMYLLQWTDYINKQKSIKEFDGSNTNIKLSIKLGNKNFYVDTETIRYCTTIDDFSKISTFEDRSFLTEKSLQTLEGLLPAQLFFRVNRQYILHRDIITGIERIKNGKLKVNLAPLPELPSSLIVSRTKAPELKGWMGTVAV